MTIANLTDIIGRVTLATVGLDRAWAEIVGRLCGHLRIGHLTVVMPDGTAMEGRGELPGPRAVLRIREFAAIRRVLIGGAIGFAEGYMAGEWETADLEALLALALANEASVGRLGRAVAIVRMFNRLRHLRRINDRRGSRRNIIAHYDLGNDFYALWLDRELSYSSALFSGGVSSLEDGQAAKYRQLLRLLAPSPGDALLEIGCGWGAFALMAAREYGCRVTALTLSPAQAAHAKARIAQARLTEYVDVRLQDYRDVDGRYDRIASIEMFEAVGEAYWPVYFATLRERLRPGGVAALQVISIDDARFQAYRRGADFVQRYIFPGGMLPSIPALKREIAAAGLRLTDRIAFGSCYARTLALWRARFLAAWPAIARLGFDDRFRRMWDYYLAYCEAGFRAGTIDVAHYRIERPGAGW